MSSDPPEMQSRPVSGSRLTVWERMVHRVDDPRDLHTVAVRCHWGTQNIPPRTEMNPRLDAWNVRRPADLIRREVADLLETAISRGSAAGDVPTGFVYRDSRVDLNLMTSASLAECCATVSFTSKRSDRRRVNGARFARSTPTLSTYSKTRREYLERWKYRIITTDRSTRVSFKHCRLSADRHTAACAKRPLRK